MNFIFKLFWIILGYLFGSLNFGIIIGKVFFKKDIREYGSRNAGGTNAGRVLGKPIGLLVIILDALKGLIIMALCNLFYKDAVAICGLMACIGHCYPVFYEFKGGKAVATGFGYLIGVGLFVSGDVVFSFICPGLIFLLVLCLFKMVSLSSMVAFISATIIMLLTTGTSEVTLCVFLITCLLIYRHRANILRIIKGEESKVSFIS